MTDKQAMILKYIKDVLKTKNAFELYRQVEKLSGVIRTESQKESKEHSKYKSLFTDEP